MVYLVYFWGFGHQIIGVLIEFTDFRIVENIGRTGSCWWRFMGYCFLGQIDLGISGIQEFFLEIDDVHDELREYCSRILVGWSIMGNGVVVDFVKIIIIDTRFGSE